MAPGRGGTIRLSLDGPEKELFTRELQQELLHLLGLIGAMQPGHEDRADHVVAQLGDAEYAKGVMSLVPPDVADDPDKLRSMRDKLDARQQERRRDMSVEPSEYVRWLPIGERISFPSEGIPFW